MKIALTDKEWTKLKAFLDAFEDAEALSTREYVVDFYEGDPPVSMDIVLTKDAIAVDGCAVLRYDEENEGWYITESIEDAEEVRRLLAQNGAL